MGVEAGVGLHRRGERPAAPVGALVAFVQVQPKLSRQDVAQPQLLCAPGCARLAWCRTGRRSGNQNRASGRGCRIRRRGRPFQSPGWQRTGRGWKVLQGKRVHQVIGLAGRKLEQANLFLVSVQTVRFGVDGNHWVAPQVGDQAFSTRPECLPRWDRAIGLQCMHGIIRQNRARVKRSH